MAQTIEELEKEIEAKKLAAKKQLESPFANVGNAVVKRGPGRPPKEESNFTEAEVAHEQRLGEIKRPPAGTTKEQMREWADNEAHDMIPDIMANKKWDVKYGDSKSRAAAGDSVLKMLGMESRDLGSMAKGGTITINMNGPANTLDLPWLKPARPVAQTIEAESKDKKDEKK